MALPESAKQPTKKWIEPEQIWIEPEVRSLEVRETSIFRGRGSDGGLMGVDCTRS